MEMHYGLFSAPISHTTCAQLIGAILPLCKGRDKSVLHLAINSDGGDLYLGVGVYNQLRSLPIKLITHNIGSVNSVANMMFLAGDERLSSPSADFGFHSAGFMLSPNTRIDERVLKEWSDKIRVKNDNMATILRQRTNLSARAVKKLLGDESFQSAAWALKNGIVHGLGDFIVPDGAHFIAHIA